MKTNMKIKPKTKFGIGFWIIKVIKSCKTLEQLEGASKLIRSFETNPKYDPPWELVCEIDRIYSSQLINLNEPITFQPDIHL
tara:strand:- start:60 stop:305 length:246 start_codon:yes stop_codon:yes gene_type:complete